MGTIKVPGRLSGRTYTVNIKGDAPSETEQARIRSMIDERESRFAQRYQEQLGKPLAEPDDGTALGRGFELGKAGAYSRLGTATEYLGRGLGLESLIDTGRSMRESGDTEAFLDSMRQPAPTTLEDVKSAKGILSTIDKGLTYVGEGVGQSAPEMLAPLAASAAGILLSGPVAGLAAGSATAFPSFFGGNIQRQEDEVAAGRKAEVDVTDAITSAIGQSVLNSIGDKLLLGGFLKPGQKWLTRTAVGMGEGAVSEIPTEITQSIIERKQAGLPLDSDDAINEYVNAGVLAGIMGGGARGVTAGLGIGIEQPQKAPPEPKTVAPVAATPTIAAPPVTAPPSETAAATETDETAVETKIEDTTAPIPTVGNGVSIDEDLAAARKIYDDALAFALDLDTEPEKAKQLAAQQAVNYVDSLAEGTRQRLSRFRSTMARVANPTRGVMPPPLPDEAYAQEFADKSPSPQKDLFSEDMPPELSIDEVPQGPVEEPAVSPEPTMDLEPEPAPEPEMDAVPEPISTEQPQLEVQDDAQTAELEPEAVGTSVEDGGRGVEPDGQPDSDVQPAEGTAAPESAGLGGGLSVPVGADTAAGAEPDTLTRLEEQLAAARARAAELRNKVPVGVLQRELVGGKVDPRLAKRVSNLQNVLARLQKAADAAKDKLGRTKVAGKSRDERLQAYEAALASVTEAQTQLTAAQDELGTAELAAGLQRGAKPKAPLTDKNQSAYTAYFNALQDADTLRKTLESERARRATQLEAPAPLPTDLREPVIPDTFLTYQRGITSKPVRPSGAPKAVAERLQKEQIMQRLVQFFMQRASAALKRYTTANGGINSPTTWKFYPDWMPLADQSRVVQLLGRLNRTEREKYKFTAAEVEPLNPDAEAAHTYFSKTIRPVDAIDMMLDDLTADYEIYEGSLRPGLTEIEHRDLMMGTGSEVAKRALNWVRANLSPKTNAEIDLILKKQAEKAEVTKNWIGDENTDRVADARKARKEARVADANAANESGYDAVSIVRKMAAGDARAALDQEMHYSVKAALSVGDLKGALRALADTTSNPELKDLANRFAGLVGTTRVRVLYPGDSAKYIGNDRGVFVQARSGIDPDYENTILINGQTGMTNHVLMHEMAHAVSSNFIDANPNHPVVKQLEALLTELRSQGPKQDWYTDGRVAIFTYPNDFYGLKNVSEMVAEAYGRVTFGETDNGLRDLMKRTKMRDMVNKQVEFENPLTAWERFKEIIANILNAAMRKPLTRRPRTKRIETIQVYETAADRFHRLVDGLLSEAPQVLPDSVMQAAVVNPMVGKNVLNGAVLGAPVWSPQGARRLGDLMSSAVPQGLRGALLGLLQLDWFNDLAGNYFPQIERLKNIDDQRRGKIQRLNESAKPVFEDLLDYAKKSPEMYNTLISIQGQATLAEVDPTEPVSKYAGDKEKTDEWYNLNRQLTTADTTGEMRNLFRKTRNTFRAMREEIKRVLKSRAMDITGDETKANNLVAQLMKKLDEENAIDPYFSLMRNGDYWLVYTAEDTTAAPMVVDPLGRTERPTAQYVQAFETPFARAEFQAKLESTRDSEGKPVAWDIETMMRPISALSSDKTVPTEFVQGALNIISSFGGATASAEERQKVEDAVNAVQELFVRLTPDHSILKSMMKRKGTRGFMGDITPLGVVTDPGDFIDAMARKVSGLSYQLANIEYGGKIQKLLDSSLETYNTLQKSGTLTEGEQAAVRAYYDEFKARAQFAKKPQVSRNAQVARGVTFAWTLGGSVAGALNNFVQLPMVGMTELGGRYGMPASIREVGFAMRALANAGKTQRVLSYGAEGKEVRTLDSVDNYGSISNYFEPDLDGNLQLRGDIKIPSKLRKKIANLDVLAEVLANNGMLNASMSQEMLESEQGWLHKINRWMGFGMHHAERFNRQSLAVAAYNLELGNASGPISRETKLAAAMKAVEIAERVNGSIGASTAPRYAQNALGSVVFMFKRFGLHMARYIINTTNQALRGATKEDRAVARYQIIGMLGTTALFAGVQGLPFFSELMTLFNVLFTDDDDERPEVVIQKFLGEPYYHGALNYMLGIDIASRISMSGLIFRENKIEKDQSVYYDLIEMFGGPAVGVAMNFERGFDLIAQGEVYRGLEAMSPSALKALMKAGRFGFDGATTLRGDEVLPVTSADIIKQMLGYTPENLARQQERVSGAKRIDEAIRSKKARLLKRYNIAVAEGDFSEARDVIKEMVEFSRKHPEEAITSDTINRSNRSFNQRSEEMISGTTFTNRSRAQQYIDGFDEDTSLWGS